MPSPDLNDTQQIRVISTTKIEGVVVPTWVAVLFLAVLVACAGSQVYLSWRVKDLQRDVNINTIYLRDVGSILIREGMATSRDFEVGPLRGGDGGGGGT